VTILTPSVSYIIDCRDVHFSYGAEEVLHSVNLAVRRGEFLPFVGDNGSGKTTLLRLILGLLTPVDGAISTPFRDSPPGYVPQQKSIDPLYPVSAREIVFMGLYGELGWWRRPSREHKQRVDQALERFDLLEHAGKTWEELSGGMKQKVMLARAFVNGAEVFIMDEPTTGLDEQSEEEVLVHLHRLSVEEGKTVLMAHHGTGHLKGLTGEVCYMDHGHLMRLGIMEYLSIINGKRIRSDET
jgi:manganese/zinc/iron transport system ATP- binding protein